jgi:hypothetical protein
MFDLMQNSLFQAAEMQQERMFTAAKQSRLIHSREAAERYRRLFWRGRVGQLWARLTGQPSHLVPLDSKRTQHSGHYAGLQIVPIGEICGSEGRSADFDRQFNPLVNHTRDRWLDIFDAQRAGQELPPVELIRLGDKYFVRDGHHRISVARTLGRNYVDAVVTVAN